LEMSFVKTSVLSSENRAEVGDMERLVSDDTALIALYKNMPAKDTQREMEIREYLSVKTQQLQQAMMN